MINNYLSLSSLNSAGNCADIFSALFHDDWDNMGGEKIAEIQVTYHLPFVVCFILILNNFSTTAFAND